MTIDIFTTTEFEDVLSAIAQDLEMTWFRDGVQTGEYHYHFIAKVFESIDDGISIEVRSSIGRDGQSAASGQDSIRIWFANADGDPVGNKAKRWITRVKGWERRLTEQVTEMATIACKVKLCPDCEQIPGVFIVKKDSPNKGRWFSKCKAHNHFTWLSSVVQKEQQKRKPKAGESPACPKCGAFMLKRHRRSDGKAFWGCSRYPDCKGTKNINPSDEFNERWIEMKDEFAQRECEQELAAERAKHQYEQTVMGEVISNPKPKEIVPSEYQKAIFDFVKEGKGHAVVEAVAGSGKTTTIVMALQYTDPDSDVAFVAFNRHIANELAKRAPKHVKVSTLHSLGYAACREAYGNEIIVKPDKVRSILESIMDRYVYGNLFSVISKFVSLVKANLSGDLDADLDVIADHYGIELNSNRAFIYDAVRLVIKKSYEQRKSVIDYDDMCWLPVVDKVVAKLFDFLFIDEAQDLNQCQIQLALMHVKAGGRIVAVGDRHQSLYGFRGADVNAIPNIIESLKAKTLPLSITYRCPKSHVQLAQTFVPEITAADLAKEGIVRDSLNLVGEAVTGDMVLCRTNAPLVAPAFALIRNGVKAVIRGRDIGKGLKVLIRKMKSSTLLDLLSKLAEYKEREISKLIAAEKTSQAQALEDKVETVIALSDGISTIYELKMRIDNVFSDYVRGVVFSSVHRAKGLEAERVFILEPSKMPHPMAKQPWEMVQERNIQYVAYTRSKHELIFVR